MGFFRRFKTYLRTNWAIRQINNRRVTPRSHTLPKPLYVSLTSYPARFGVLPMTLACLLKQTMNPDAVILWVGEADMAALPEAILSMRSEWFHIRATRDLRSYTKIIPLLAEQPDAYIVTADDDLYYRETWLEDLVKTAVAHPGQVVAHRTHRITYASDGAMNSYEMWKKDRRGAVAGADIFATGVGGVLYPPGCLHPDTGQIELFQQLAPHSDDIWLYWMARRQGTLVRRIGPSSRVIEWPESQSRNLRSQNRGTAGQNGNDRAIAAMTAHFGRP